MRIYPKGYRDISGRIFMKFFKIVGNFREYNILNYVFL